MNPEQIADIEARERAATVGPWFLDSNGVGAVFVGIRADGREHGLWEIVHMSADALGDLKPEHAEQVRDDAVFIAHAREDIPALLAVLREQTETIARVRKLALAPLNSVPTIAIAQALAARR